MLTARSTVLMRNMLMRGFTTVRDTGGADFGIRDAVAEGLVLGPRLFVAGAPVSQTGGHGDFRRPTQSGFGCVCCSALSFTARVADGRSEEHTSELQSLMRISYAVFCLKKNKSHSQ